MQTCNIMCMSTDHIKANDVHEKKYFVTSTCLSVMIKNKKNKIIYYIFGAISIPFSVIFEDDKSDNFLRGDISFRMLKRTESRQKQRQMT